VLLERPPLRVGDRCAEVRRTAVHALCSLLSHGTPSSGRADGIGVQTGRLVDALDRAGEFQMDPETRCAYFECVSHLVGRASYSLSAADMDRLMPPLVDAWNSLPWNPDVARTTAAGPPHPGTVAALSVALGTVATYGKSLYAPSAEGVFEKACRDIEGCVFHPRDAFLPSADFSCRRVSGSVYLCLSHAGIVSKQLHGLSRVCVRVSFHLCYTVF